MAPNTPSNPIPSGHVIAQQQTSGKDATGKYVDGWDVTAQLDGMGAAFTVFIPASQYTPDNVRAALEERAAQVAAVHGITFGS